MEHFVDLAQYAPPFLQRVRELAEIWRTEGYEVGLLQYYINDLFNQAFVSTATWGLTSWEDMYGVTTDMALSYEQRREILTAKIRGQGTTTKEMIRQTAEAFSGGEVEVIEDNGNHLFIVRFVGIKGVPDNMPAFIGMLEDIKPAHLAYRFEYTYTIWANFNGSMIWDDVKPRTWDDVMVMEGV